MQKLAFILVILTACEPCPTPLHVTQFGERSEFVDVETLRDQWSPGCEWIGDITWRAESTFMCDGREVRGCYYRAACPEKIEIGYNSGALRHELAHACGELDPD